MGLENFEKCPLLLVKPAENIDKVGALRKAYGSTLVSGRGAGV